MEPYAALQDKEPPKAPRNQWLDVWDQFKKHKGAVLGGGFLVFITLAVLLGPYIWNVDPQKLDIRNKDVRPIWTLSGTVPQKHCGTAHLVPITWAATYWQT